MINTNNILAFIGLFFIGLILYMITLSKDKKTSYIISTAFTLGLTYGSWYVIGNYLKLDQETFFYKLALPCQGITSLIAAIVVFSGKNEKESKKEGEAKEETIVSACELFGVSRQVYYRSKQSLSRRQSIAAKVVELVLSVRQQMPRIGTRKLYYLLQHQLNDIGVGRDKLFAILKANHMLVKQKRNYRRTIINS